MPTMKAVVFDGQQLQVVHDHPLPEPQTGWARVQVQLAGICRTDLELIEGYRGFRGVLGHEFLGRVETCDEPSWIGKRVVGEITAACGRCAMCAQGLGRHCLHGACLGIFGLDGCMAEYCVLPTANLQEVPDSIPDTRAILTEPLAAACEILEQIRLLGPEKVVVLGDGRLGILCAWALSTICSDLTLVGHHPEKLELARWRGIQTVFRAEDMPGCADLVVEATGSGLGIAQAMAICRPRGTIVLKSTVTVQGEVNLAPLVVNELNVVGSRCGRFSDALAMMASFSDMPLERLVTNRFPLDRAKEAFARSADGRALKVVLSVCERAAD